MRSHDLAKLLLSHPDKIVEVDIRGYIIGDYTDVIERIYLLGDSVVFDMFFDPKKPLHEKASLIWQGESE